MEPDLQALLAERAALALSLGVTVDDEVFFLEDLLLEVQLLREEQRRRSGLAAPDAPSAAVAAPDESRGSRDGAGVFQTTDAVPADAFPTRAPGDAERLGRAGPHGPYWEGLLRAAADRGAHGDVAPKAAARRGRGRDGHAAAVPQLVHAPAGERVARAGGRVAGV